MQPCSCFSRRARFAVALGLSIAPVLAGCGGESTGGADATSPDSGATDTPTEDPRFSFFVTSLDALRTLSKNQNGFGGDLRYGETGDGAGLRGADKICTTIAEMSMAGSGAKGWHAFLSAPAAGASPQVNAIDRIGNGPWYDRMGRLVSSSKANLLAFRPVDADSAIKNDLPNEYGIPNHMDGAPGCTNMACPDNHDTLTGSGEDGKLWTGTPNPTCSGWTSAVGSAGKPHVGHCWPRGGMTGTGGRGGIVFDGGVGGISNYGHWISSLDEAGCAAGINLQEMGPPNPNNPTVGSGGGYGGFYCFATSP